ncbi:hypothetical protein Tco_1010360, partial [Tanacetum coccineum]
PSVTISSHEDVLRYLNENPVDVMTDLLNELMYTETQTISVVPLPEDNPEVHDDVLVDTVISSPTATTTNIPTTKSKKKRAKKLLHKAIRRKIDSKTAIMQKLSDHEQRLNALSQINHAVAIEESVQANVLNEVKNQLPKFVPKPVFDYAQPCLERTILNVMKKNPIDLFKSSTPLFDNSTKYKLKHKPSRKKRSHDDQDPRKNHEGEKKKRRRKGAGESSSKKEGIIFHDDLSKLLPLEGPPGRKTIPIRYFFNKDLEYLMHGNKEKKYALSLSKVKAARYEHEGIEEMIPHL